MEHYKNLSLRDIVEEINNIVYIEQWKYIIGYEGLYMISDFGRVKSLGQIVKRGRGVLFNMPEKILKLGLTQNGYLHTSFYKGSIAKTMKIHTLVWDHFGETKRNGFVLQVDHIDEIKTNNWIGNLRLLTSRDNILRNFKNSRYLLGVRSDPKCKSRYQSRIFIDGKRITLGSFGTELEAHNAYLKAKTCA